MPDELSVVTEQLPKSQVGMTIEVPTEVVDATYERVLNRLVSRAKIEGFRPGRAPRALVEARLGPAVIREEVVETMIPDVIRRALEEKSIDPIDNPDVEVLELERGRPARLKATISVMPAVELADATRLKPETQAIEITDEMLERRLADGREPLGAHTALARGGSGEKGGGSRWPRSRLSSARFVPATSRSSTSTSRSTARSSSPSRASRW